MKNIYIGGIFIILFFLSYYLLYSFYNHFDYLYLPKEVNDINNKIQESELQTYNSNYKLFRGFTLLLPQESIILRETEECSLFSLDNYAIVAVREKFTDLSVCEYKESEKLSKEVTKDNYVVNYVLFDDSKKDLLYNILNSILPYQSQNSVYVRFNNLKPGDIVGTNFTIKGTISSDWVVDTKVLGEIKSNNNNLLLTFNPTLIQNSEENYDFEHTFNFSTTAKGGYIVIYNSNDNSQSYRLPVYFLNKK